MRTSVLIGMGMVVAATIIACGATVVPRAIQVLSRATTLQYSFLLSDEFGFFRCDALGFNQGTKPKCMDQYAAWLLTRPPEVRNAS